MIFSALAKGFKAGRSAWMSVKKPMPKLGPTLSSIVKKAGSAAGIVGTYAAADVVAGQLSSGLFPSGGGLPGLNIGAGSGAGALATLQRPGAGIQSVMPDVLDPSLLKTYYRAPKGYVIVRDPSTGAVMAVRKQIAKSYGLWRAPRKPPISAGDWHKFQTAKSVEKKLVKIAGPALRKRQHAAAGRAVRAKKGR
jgi:sugar (pentulose or hexulose) kinase